jgi:hypothetical protein
MGHCSGGVVGPDNADFLGAIATWVEEGQAPERIIASRTRQLANASFCQHWIIDCKIGELEVYSTRKTSTDPCRRNVSIFCKARWT